LTVRAGEPFDASRAGAEVTELLVADVPAAGPTTAEGDPATGEWTGTTGAGFRIVPLWEGESLTGLYDAAWAAAEGIGTTHLTHLAEVLSAHWGPHHVITLDGPLLSWHQSQPVHPLFEALFRQDLYSELHVWHVGTRWIALTVGHSDGDAPLVLAAVVSTEEIQQPPGP